MKLVELVNATDAIRKVADSNNLPASYVWELLDFVDGADKELRKFDMMRNKIIEECTEEIDGQKKLNQTEFLRQLDELFKKEIDLDSSVLDMEQIKKVNGLSVKEAMSLKELMNEE